jgi:hypothetical protein
MKIDLSDISKIEAFVLCGNCGECGELMAHMEAWNPENFVCPDCGKLLVNSTVFWKAPPAKLSDAEFLKQCGIK